MGNLFSVIYQNVCSLYKHFIPWNIAKICIEVWSFLLGILFSLPFFLILLLLLWLDPIPWASYMNGSTHINLPFEILVQLRDSMFIVIIELIIALCALTAVFFGWSYKGILRIKLVKDYYDKNTLFHTMYEKVSHKFFGVHYLKWEMYKSYFSINKDLLYAYAYLLAWMGLYLLIPVLIFIVVVLIWVGLYINNLNALGLMVVVSPFNPFTISIGVTLLAMIGVFFYILYRIYFAIIIFVDSKEPVTYTNVKNILHTSFTLTSGKKTFMNFMTIYVVFGICTLPFTYIIGGISDKHDEMKRYENYQVADTLTDTEKDDYENLKILYSEYTDDEIASKLRLYTYGEIICGLIIFFLITGYMDMVMYAFYKESLEKGKKEL